MRNAIVATITLGLVTLTGCTQGPTTPLTIPSIRPPTTLTTSETGTSSGQYTTEAPGSPTAPDPGHPVIILGVIRAGALPGCDTLLADDGKHYLLLNTVNPPRNIPVEVTGVPDTSLVSYCNSGQPLHVLHISRR